MNVVGLGAAGCALAKSLSTYPQYNVYLLDNGLQRKGNTYPVAHQPTHEQYDAQEIKLTQFVSRMSKDSSEVLFIMGGGGNISGASLQVLRQLDKRFKNKIDILYIKPDVEMLSKTARQQDKICYRVLQEYARSGVFRSMLLVSNPHMEAAAGKLPIKNYYENLNSFTSYVYHMVNVFTRSTALMSSTSGQRREHLRIYTVGTFDIEKNEEKLFFPLDNIENRCYYYAIKDERLEKDENLLETIRNQIKSNTSSTSTCSYSVHSSANDADMAFVACWSGQVQSFPEIYRAL